MAKSLCLLISVLLGREYGPSRQTIALLAAAALGMSLLAIYALPADWLPVAIGVLTLFVAVAVAVRVVWRRRSISARVFPELWPALAGGHGSQPTGIGRAEWFRSLRAIELPEHIPRLTFPHFPQPDEPQIAEEIRQGSLRLLKRPAVPIGRRIAWDRSPFADRTWALILHSLTFLDSVIEAYKRSGDPNYLRRAESIVFDWIGGNSSWFVAPPSEFSWEEHAVAIRVLVLLRFWKVWIASELADAGKAIVLLRTILGHARDLADPRKYPKANNHGIDRDIALVAIAVSFRQFRQSAAWVALSVRRLCEQLKATVSAAGMHLEHSPSYQVTTLAHLTELRRLAEERETEPFSSDDFLELLVRMARCASCFIKPNGQMVLFGDTSPTVVIGRDDPEIRRFVDLVPELLWAATSGRDGAPGPDLNVFRQEGYAILRKFDRGRYEDSLHFAFTAASNRGLVHKHADDLGFTLYANGRDLVIDHGYHSYNSDDARRYIVGPYAHNVVVVDDPVQSHPHVWATGNARLTNAFESRNFVVIQGECGDHPLLRHRRTVVYVDPDAFYIIDQVHPVHFARGKTAAASYRFRSLLHFPSDTSASAGEGHDATITVRDAARNELLEVTATSEQSIGCRIAFGEKDPLLGWTSPGHGVIVPAPALIVEAVADRLTLVTELALGPRRLLRAPSIVDGTVTLSCGSPHAEAAVIVDRAGQVACYD